MRGRDYYRVLQVDPAAEPMVIQAAYRRLAAKYHPDVAPTAERQQAEMKMRELNEAYRVLSDPESRARYDEQAGEDEDIPRGYQTRFRARFDIEPDSIELPPIDPWDPVVPIRLTLHQIAGRPFNPSRDGLSFTMERPLRLVRVARVEFHGVGDPLDITVWLDFTAMNPHHYVLGAINLRGDPGSRFLVHGNFLTRPVRRRTPVERAPAEAAASHPRPAPEITKMGRAAVVQRAQAVPGNRLRSVIAWMALPWRRPAATWPWLAQAFLRIVICAAVAITAWLAWPYVLLILRFAINTLILIVGLAVLLAFGSLGARSGPGGRRGRRR